MIPASLSLNPIYFAPSSWWQHVPIAHWLVETTKPKRIVELGTHYGVSFFSFCEAAEAFSPNTFVYAIDTWSGDEHASFYGEEVFGKVNEHWENTHKCRSTLIRSEFDKAIEYFEDHSIDILHIDGLHTYEAVKHDFETWLPKMSSNSLILLHDINVREREFGVWRLWEELQARYKTFEVLNGHGLGILLLGEKMNAKINEFSTLSKTLTSRGLLLERMAQLTPGASFGLHPIEQARKEVEQARKEVEQAKAETKDLLETLNRIKSSRKWRLISKMSHLTRSLMGS